MELIIFVILLCICGVLAFIGFFTKPPNAYMIMFSALVMFIISANLIAEGLEVPNKQSDIQVNISSSTAHLEGVNVTTYQINGTAVGVKEVPTGLRNNSMNIILLLLSLYLAFLGISIMIENKYGSATSK